MLILFWDYCLDEEMMRLGRKYVFELDYDFFAAHIDHFPQDTYIFDQSFQKTLVMTHEGYSYGKKDLWLFHSP